MPGIMHTTGKCFFKEQSHGDKMNRGIITIFIFIGVVYMSCGSTEKKVNEKPVLIRTAQELIAEFTEDWEKAQKFYQGKNIEVSGVLVYVSRVNVGLGEYPLGANRIEDFLINNILISCEFSTMLFSYGLKQDENLVILGEFLDFFNTPDVKGIRLKNCIILSREIEGEKDEP